MADDFVCELHGASCINEKGGSYQRQPAFLSGEHWEPITAMSTLPVLLRESESACPVLKMFSAISILRRTLRNPPPDFSLFSGFLREDIWHLLAKSSTRVLKSILDTLADDPKTRSAGTSAVVFLQLEWMARRISSTSEAGITRKFHLDVIMNFLGRLRAALFSYPLVWLIFYEVFQRSILECRRHRISNRGNDHLFSQYDTQNAINIQDKEYVDPLGGSSVLSNSLTAYALDLLRPSIVSAPYVQGASILSHLRCKFLRSTRGVLGASPLSPSQDNDYGEGDGFPARSGEFLHQHAVREVLDLGCGRGRRPTNDFDWDAYDPSDEERNVLPKRAFDGVVAYDVLERLSDEELGVVFMWLELYAKDCLVLGMATGKKPAVVGSPGHTWLRSGDPADFATQSAEWWSIKIQEFLPQFSLVERKLFYSHKESRSNYVVFHLVRAAVK